MNRLHSLHLRDRGNFVRAHDQRDAVVGYLGAVDYFAADIRPGGSLTLVSGFLSIRPRPNSAIVSAANGALESLARALALELAPVRVNAVSPGVVDTPIRAAMPEDARRDMLAKTAASLPVGRVGVGEDIARQILGFMTIGFATGSIVYVDGGALVS